MNSVTRRTVKFATLACALALALPALTAALPKSTVAYLLGPRMIRSEVWAKGANNAYHDYRLDRGRIVKRTAGTLVVAERDGTQATLKVAANARVMLNGKPAKWRQLRAGMQAVVSRTDNLPADVVYTASPTATAKIPDATIASLLGPKMLRAEIGLKSADGVVHDYLLDQGRVRQVNPYVLTLREADGQMVTINVTATAHVKLNGKNASFAQLRKGMMATTMRDGDKPADQVWAATRKK
jgi:biopolymer transport protein ExbD